MALTGKKLIFANAVLAGSSNKEAAIAAGYSAATASQAGSRLVKDLAVAAYLATRRPAPGAALSKPTPDAPAVPPVSPFNLAAAMTHSDPDSFLMAAMNDPTLTMRERMEAAKALMPFKHHKLGEGGKKDQKNEEAKKVASRFSTAAPPKLVAAGGKKI
jgi:phage terminase small subunit